MADQVEKLRKVLSTNSDFTLNIECLAEDNDLNAMISR